MSIGRGSVKNSSMVHIRERGGESARQGVVCHVPSEDAQRVWFPEMREALTASGAPATSWDERVVLCGDLTALRADLRWVRGIDAPRRKCCECGGVWRGDTAGGLVRSAFLALREVCAVSAADFQQLDRDGKRYRTAREINLLARRALPWWPQRPALHPGAADA